MGSALIFFGFVLGILTVLATQEGRNPPKWVDVIMTASALCVGIGVAITVIEALG